MNIAYYHTINPIKKQYGTGEEPVLAMCSDLNEYVCKYMKSSSMPYKLICEIIGAVLASEWSLRIPNFALIKLSPEHWTPYRSINLSAPAFGSEVQQSVVDVSSTWNNAIKITPYIRYQILSIALFDLWVANEDRNWNNANLLYDVDSNELIVIDHGCILNTATFDYKLSVLTENESILYSELAHTILKGVNQDSLDDVVVKIKKDFESVIHKEKSICTRILDSIPKEWNVNVETVKCKIDQLFEKKWIEDCWNTFVEYYKESLK